MVEQGSGSIINMASLYGVVSPNHRMYPGTGIVQPPAYSVSKAGVIALTRYLATLWAQSRCESTASRRVASSTITAIFFASATAPCAQLDAWLRKLKCEEP